MRAAALAVLSVAAVLFVAEPAFAGKIDPTPTSFAIDEGTTQDVDFVLDEPIIAISGDTGVTLSFTADDPSRVSFSPSTLRWEQAEWAQHRVVTVTAVADGTHNDTNTVVVTAEAATGSEYYYNYQTTFTLTLADLDPAPTTTTVPADDDDDDGETTSTTAAGVSPTSVPASEELPRTGTSPWLGLVASGVCLTTGGLLVVSRRRR